MKADKVKRLLSRSICNVLAYASIRNYIYAQSKLDDIVFEITQSHLITGALEYKEKILIS